MSAIRQQEQQICEFLFKSLEGELSDEEIAKLEQLIASDADARRSYLEHVMLIADLLDGMRSDSLGDFCDSIH
jgi:anti-sigma factor RsiW